MAVDWSDVKKGFDPGKASQAFYLVRGKPGVGKTTFASGIEESLLVDCDPAEGGKYVVGPRAERKSVRSWEQFEEIHARLKKDAIENKDKRRFKTVIIDPAGQLLTFCRDRIKKKLGVDEITGFDHGTVASLFREKYLDLLNHGYYLVITDHEIDMRSLQKGGIEKIVTEALLPQSITKYLEQDCHHILTLTLDHVTRDVIDPVTKKPKLDKVLTFRITTRPGKRTSIANPKARVWLPEVLEDLPQVGDASKLWDHFAAQYDKAVAAMRSVDGANAPKKE